MTTTKDLIGAKASDVAAESCKSDACIPYAAKAAMKMASYLLSAEFLRAFYEEKIAELTELSETLCIEPKEFNNDIEARAFYEPLRKTTGLIAAYNAVLKSLEATK